MTTNLMTLTPLMRQTVGFDRFNELFQSLMSDPGEFENYPPYNIEKIGEDGYRITMAVAGFTMDDLEIVLQDDELAVSGRRQEKDADENIHILHRGIATRPFQRIFRLAEFIKVTGAEMKDGLLTINLERQVPEEKKPRMIPIKIGGSNGKAALEHKRLKH